jgi:hypothetical protein
MDSKIFKLDKYPLLQIWNTLGEIIKLKYAQNTEKLKPDVS